MGERLINAHPEKLLSTKGPVSQRGAGAYTLCPKCNNTTGRWFGSAYAQWALQGAYLVGHAQVAPSLYHIFHIFPQRVIKQVFCMFFSANHPTFAEKQQDLVRFVLNKDWRYSPRHLRVFAYFNAGAVSRQSAISGRVDLARGETHTYSETAFPPFGYILSVDGNSPDERLVDITHFSRYAYNDWVDVQLRLPVFNLYTWVPGDFRSKKEVLSIAKP